MKRNQSGFTLIEIAIVLVIIGLLLGGVLKGQELINSARVKNIAMDFKNVPVFIYGYQDKFRSLPGDDPNSATHVGAAAIPATTPAASIGNGTIDGSWDSITATDESVVFWQQVRMAGMTSGQQNITVTGILDPYFPMNAVGGRIGVQGNLGTAASPRAIAGIPGTYVICSGNIAGKFAKQLDIMLDDGNTQLGNMRVTLAPAGTASVVAGQAVAAIPLVDDTLYTVCMGV
jgi:prepilin-type N-terminal cleavage/methylation domain-containing protein